MKAMQSQKVIAAVKHFPGHGQTEKDSHFFLPKINADAMVLENEDMKPFEEAIKNGCDAIMVGHLVVKSMDRFNPASLSKKIINTYLKQKYNFKGLIITDDLSLLKPIFLNIVFTHNLFGIYSVYNYTKLQSVSLLKFIIFV